MGLTYRLCKRDVFSGVCVCRVPCRLCVCRVAVHALQFKCVHVLCCGCVLLCVCVLCPDPLPAPQVATFSYKYFARIDGARREKIRPPPLNLVGGLDSGRGLTPD